MRQAILLLAIAGALHAQTYHAPQLASVKTPAPTAWWLHGPCALQATMAFADGLSSWRQGEGNVLLVETFGPQAGHFYRTGAARLGAFTGGIVAASYVVGYLKPSWRRYIGILNLGMGAGHAGAVAYNLRENPIYR